MAENGRVHPDCVNASNPYHECGIACLEKIAQGQGRKEKKKSDNGNGIKGVLSKKMDGETRGHSTCPKASNPYHVCNKHCSNRTAEAKHQGVENGTGSFKLDSFGRKKKGSESQPVSPKVVNNVSAVKSVYPTDTQSPRSPYATEKKVSPEVANSISSIKAIYRIENSQSFPSPRSPYSAEKKEELEHSQSCSSSQQHSEEEYHSFDKGQVKSSEAVPMSGNLMVMSDRPKSPSNGSFTCFAIATPAKLEENGKLQASPKAASSPVAKNAIVTSGPIVKSMNLTLSGISRASEDSDEEEVQSVISDSCVSVGKYHVRAIVASLLQSILDKYGDIAANCQLESASMRAYYLECLCSVVQELQSSSLKQLTKSKFKEMLAVLKDVESVGIDVSWLHAILNELTEAVEINNQHQAAEAAKADRENAMESTRKELESMMEDLAQKEKEVAGAKARIDETRARLSELEVEFSQLSDTLQSISLKAENIHSKSLVEIL